MSLLHQTATESLFSSINRKPECPQYAVTSAESRQPELRTGGRTNGFQGQAVWCAKCPYAGLVFMNITSCDTWDVIFKYPLANSFIFSYFGNIWLFYKF